LRQWSAAKSRLRPRLDLQPTALAEFPTPLPTGEIMANINNPKNPLRYN
jgi:hypothetical protein